MLNILYQVLRNLSHLWNRDTGYASEEAGHTPSPYNHGSDCAPRCGPGSPPGHCRCPGGGGGGPPPPPPPPTGGDPRGSKLRHYPIVGLLALVLLLLTASLAPGQRLQLPAQEQEDVNHAIDRGVAYLKKAQHKNGTWADPLGNWPGAQLHGHYYAVGCTALPGLTLLECGVPASDPVVQRAAQYVRSRAAGIDRTYELSLAILFLDRLGDPQDKKLIQTFALRLIAGQSATGGWGYRCPLFGEKSQMELLTALRHLDQVADDKPGLAGQIGKKPGDMAPIARAGAGPSLEGTPAQPGSPSLSGGISRGSRGESPSQEVGKAPQEAKPNAKAVGPSIAKAEQPESTKPYTIPERIKALPVIQDPARHTLQDPLEKPNDLIRTTTDNSNTQFAILALWRAQHYEVPTKRSLNLIVRRYQNSQNTDGSWGYYYRFGGGAGPLPFPTPNCMTPAGLIGLAVGHGLAGPRQAGQPMQDAQIVKGLTALGSSVGQPVDHRGMVPMQSLYFLWSLERVAVLYDLPTIGGKDWYRWGAQVLVRNQQSEGSWAGGLFLGFNPPLDTSLALLFLRCSNLAKDLTAKLTFSANDLNNSIMDKRTPPAGPAQLPKQTKKPELPTTPRKSEEATRTVREPPVPQEVAPSEKESDGGNKKGLVLSIVLFLIFSGASLFFIVLAIKRRKDAPPK
jgi:hypothetical protein